MIANTASTKLITGALLWLPAAAFAQHGAHSQPDHGGHARPTNQAQHSDHSPHKGHPQHGDHLQQNHSRDTDHSPHTQPAQAADHNPHTVPPVTEADRAAAFPPLAHQHRHGDSTHSFWLMDQLEFANHSDGTGTYWDASAWIGGDLNRLWLRTEGEAVDSAVESSQIEVLYSRAVRPWWDLVAGVRQDFGDGPNRTWAAFGVQGTAPYMIEFEATAYLGEQGRTALNLTAQYDLLFTNKLILGGEAEATAYGKSDEDWLIGSGLSTVELGVRLRYEITRQFAPYIGYVQEWSYGDTADLWEQHQQPREEHRWVAGVRFWF